ncbi:hypothetical protein [Novosphingobium malaysiense]|uniref:hypothetical protein n=1 Tax=Novosphingobium malaysiense TaxID=1348853 RepID=UPI00068CAEC8|nr:hypothetical protein [Novosphingobium malaysiense]
MNDQDLDRWLQGLAERPLAMDAEEDFHERVWQRIGQMSEARDQRRRTVLGLAMVAVALGTGIGATHSPAHAARAGLALADGSDLSPAALLHVSP